MVSSRDEVGVGGGGRERREGRRKENTCRREEG